MSRYSYNFIVFILLGALDKLLLLAPIDEGGKSGNDEYSQVNSSAIKPCCCVMVGIGSNVLKDEGASRGYDQHLQHEVIQCLKKDLAEGLGFERCAVVVAELCSSGWERISRDARADIHFKLVTDAFDHAEVLAP